MRQNKALLPLLLAVSAGAVLSLGTAGVAAPPATSWGAQPAAAAGVGYRAGIGAYANTTRLAARVPASVMAGDALLLLVTGNRTDTTLGVPAGWVLLRRVTDGTLQSAVWWKVAGTGDAGGSVPVTATAVTKVSAQVLAYSGTAAAPVQAFGVAVEPGSSATHRTPPVTVTGTGSWVLSYWADKTQAGTGWSTPAALVRRVQTPGSGGGRITSVSADSGTVVAPGTAAGLTATSTAASTMAAMWTIALRPAAAPPSLALVDDAVPSGLYDVNESWEAEPVDYDSDGWADLWIGYHDQGARLYRNDHDGTFTRVAAEAWPKVNAYGRIPDRHDCAFADVDGDGRMDAYCSSGRGSNNPVKTGRPNELWLQRSPGVFTEVGQQWGVEDVCGRGHYVAFLDANGDGWPDLYLGNAPPRDDPADPCNVPANRLPSEESKLFVNDGGKALVPTTTMGITGYSGVRCAEPVDYNGDGWTDLLACGDPATFLYKNLAGQGFQDVAAAQGFGAVVTDAVAKDLDGDGDPDLVTVSWGHVDYRLNANGVFGPPVRVASFTAGRAVDVADVDGDGDQDIYALLGDGTSHTNPDDLLYLNDRMAFAPMAVPAAAGGVGDAVTAMDAEHDGHAELVVLNGLDLTGPVQVVRATTG